MTPRFLTLSLLIFATAALRLLPHWPNFTPVVALALFAGAYVEDRRLAFVVPLAALLLSDWVLGFYPGMVFVYSGFAVSVLIGFALRRRRGLRRIAAGTLAGAIAFFLISNFGAWLTTGLYPQNTAGLAAAYVAGIPFFRNALAGDAVYVALLFGGFWLAERRFAWLRQGSDKIGQAAL
ncbi:hypothetical protein BJI67_11650 [Acidihalobacter aeolianus]|uniref:Rod shape-determining protein MreD n=1 Tax=Acidihalobacter aeolianus TaxID=2792603 RepID=A0A1D8K9K4_9GAMM|nr:DUF6580 family putative transport protein [Acidihalobacter aeolianus]AOV17627.1 hypothetical protein BJI67_11650 [Acidihalobacter aeolianus]